MRRWFLVVFLILALIGGQVNAYAADKAWSDEEKLAKLTKPAVVRIAAYYWALWSVGGVQIFTAVGGHGSGAFISSDGYITTNAHVVQAYTHSDQQMNQNLVAQLYRTLMVKYQQTPQQAQAWLRLAKVVKWEKKFAVIPPGGDELPFDLKEIGSPVGTKDGKDVAIIKVEGRNFPTVTIGDSDKVRTGEKVFVAGYPGSADMDQYQVLSQKSALQWSWAHGTISSDKKASSQGAPLLQVNAEGVTHGNSGGPVLNSDGKVIGLLTFGPPELQGLSFAVTSHTVLEFVRKSGATNTPSPTDIAYRDGLNFYWQGYYSKALPKFEEVKRLYAKHSEAEELIADCQHNIAQGKDKRYWPDYYPYMAATALVVIIAVIALIVLKRRKALNQKTPTTPEQQADQQNNNQTGQ